MNPSTALATVLVDELVRCGVREVVLAPGSRSAPLAYAVQQAERDGRLRLHVRVDERSAGFLALGLAKVSRRPAVVITTSGTAVANLHPAVLEAHHAEVPLIVLSADRPDELRGTGANQTTVQPGIFAGAVRWQHDLTNFWGGLDRSPRNFGVVSTAHPTWRTTVDRAWVASSGVLGSRPGPVHLNVAFRDPLAPDLPVEADEPSAADAPALADASAAVPPELAGRPGGLPWTAVPQLVGCKIGHGCPTLHPNDVGDGARGGVDQGGSGGEGIERATPRRPSASGRADRGDPGASAEGPATLVVLGDLPEAHLAGEALAVAVEQGWPVIAEPFGAGDRSTVLPHGSLILTATDWINAHPPERVVVVGRCTLDRETGALLRRAGVRVVAITPTDTWPDPSHVVDEVHSWSALVDGTVRGGDPDWARTWVEAGAAVAGAVEPVLADSWPSGPAVAKTVLDALEDEDLLVLGSSNAARDVGRAGLAGRHLQITGNRGLAGIDGTNATALGIALAAPARRVVALVGDLTFLHDLNGLLIGPDEPRPDLTIVVVNDDGGGIFTTLEYGEPARSGDFERVFGTPTGADLEAACAAYGVAHERASDAATLRESLGRPTRGLRVIEVAVPRAGHRDQRMELVRVTAQALTEH